MYIDSIPSRTMHCSSTGLAGLELPVGHSETVKPILQTIHLKNWEWNEESNLRRFW